MICALVKTEFLLDLPIFYAFNTRLLAYVHSVWESPVNLLSGRCLPQHWHVQSIRLPDAGSGQDRDPSDETVVANYDVSDTTLQQMNVRHVSRGLITVRTMQLCCSLKIWGKR